MGKLEAAIQGWENSLLDLGRRNRMINYPTAQGKRPSRQTLRLVEPGYAEIYDLLARQGKALTVQQPPVEKYDLRCEAVLRLFERLGSPVAPMEGELRPEGSFAEYRQTLKNLRAKDNLAREEQGVGLLHLGVGFLDWKQLTGKMESLTSPLLLLPVRLKMQSIRAPYVLEAVDEDAAVNPALRQLFHMEYGLSLPELTDPDAPVDAWLDEVEALAKKHGWALRREAQLALIPFQKISMYHDLRRSHDRVAASSVLRAIAGEAAYPLDASVMDGVELDRIPPEESHLVVNADSSQQYAVELSRRGVSFCLQGPPGGGKSQTITNIIAQAMADGRRVLFVAEKMAALDVVRRRLQEAGLADFVLSLHSHRADRRSVLKELGQPLNLEKQQLDHKAMTTLDELDDLRQSLNIYPVLLHRLRQPLNESLYTALGELAGLQDLPLVMAKLTGVEAVSRSALTAELVRLGRLAGAWQRYEALPENPWEGLMGSHTTFMARAQLNAETAAARRHAEALVPLTEGLTAEGLLPAEAPAAALAALQRLCAAAQQSPVTEDFVANAPRTAELFRDAEAAAARLRAALAEAEATLLPGAECSPEALARLTALDSDIRAALAGSRWQQETDAFATHYMTLAGSIRRMTDNAEAALSLLGGDDRTGREADWCLDACAALAALPETLAELPDPAASESLLQRVHAVREGAGQLLALLPEALGHLWTADALKLDGPGMLRRFQNDYTGLSRLTSLGRYNQDMKALSAVYAGPGRPDEMAARSFLGRLSAWQTHRQSWSREAYAVTQQLGVAALPPDGPWEALEARVSALTALGRAADTPDHRARLLTALAHPDIRQKAAAIREPFRYGALDRSLRSADFAGDAMADDVAATLRAILTASEDLTALRALLNELRPACREGTAFPELLEALRAADEALRQQRMLAEALSDLASLTGTQYDEIADFAALAAQAENIAQVCADAKALPEGVAHALLTGARPLPEMPESLPAAIENLTAFCAHFRGENSPLALPVSALCRRLSRCAGEPEALDLWQEWRDALSDVTGTLFAPFVPEACRLALPAEAWPDAARKLFLYTWVEKALETEHLLSLFRARDHEERIARFGLLDGQQLHIARSRIRKQLIDGMPDEGRRALSATDEMAILQREMMKKRGCMPLRKLFSKIPHLLTTLKPCLMMSPLSVASYLESGEIAFDLVIFDEASQIMPENAIGAILRGKQVIVAGDTKQMPPTDFFSVSVSAGDFDSEDEDDTEEDAAPGESILEQCAAVLPSCPLLWHYRSRHESLIAFSNREIYGGRLVTFPGSIARQPHLGVELVRVEGGLFQRRRNKKEAEVCVRLIEEHILHRPHRSLGVVAFSRTQQAAIEEELHRFRMARPEYDAFFAEGRDEPFFIKNLENVQGDERDAMIFSVGYAPKGDGKPMSLNLGPLSATGGERRLNVAITRARCNVKLVTSIRASDIDLSRTAAEGTRLLRAYIDYAEHGFAAPEESAATPAAPANAFADRLAAVLTEAGYGVETGVGTSGCRVDVAVRRPGDESSYALGVMTDGPAYAAQRTCRDRDSLQASVLKGMGWRLHRVWSADWLQNPVGVERALLSAAEKAVQEPAVLPEAPAPEETAWTHPAPPATPALTAFADYEPARLPAPKAAPEMAALPGGGHPPALPAGALPINELIWRVVEAEQPVHRDELCRRLAPALGHDRVNPTLRRDVEVAIARLKLDDLRETDGFLTREGFRLARPRVAGGRSIDMIAPEELQMAILTVAENSIGAAREDILARVSELLGFERRGPRIQKALEDAFDRLIRAGRLVDSGSLAAPAATALPAPVSPKEVTRHD